MMRHVSNPQHPDNPFSSGEQPIAPEPQAYSARVPERVARGIYSPQQVVIDGQREFIIDFLQGLTRPYQVAARVVLMPQTFDEFIAVLEQNLELYKKNFGDTPALPPATPRRLTAAEIYDHFKLPDDLLSGAYANQVMIGHSPTEFVMDFITGFYPTPAVSARVYLPAGVIPRFLQSLRASAEQFRSRQNPPAPPAVDPSA
jgi:hypothetical protein